MVASIGGCHLQLKEQFSLAEASAILEEPFCLITEVGDTSAVPLRQTLNANCGKKHYGVDVESTLRHTPECSPGVWRQSGCGDEYHQSNVAL